MPIEIFWSSLNNEDLPLNCSDKLQCSTKINLVFLEKILNINANDVSGQTLATKLSNLLFVITLAKEGIRYLMLGMFKEMISTSSWMKVLKSLLSDSVRIATALPE